MWHLLLLFFFGAVYTAPTKWTHEHYLKMNVTGERYLDAIKEFQVCANKSDSYKLNGTYPVTMTALEAGVIRDSVYSCILTGENMLKLKDEYVTELGGSSNSGMPTLAGLFTSLTQGDVSPLAGVQNFAAELFKIALVIMRNDVKQLDKFIATGERSVFTEKMDTTEIDKIFEKIANDAKIMLPGIKKGNTPNVELLLPGKNEREKGLTPPHERMLVDLMKPAPSFTICFKTFLQKLIILGRCIKQELNETRGKEKFHDGIMRRLSATKIQLPEPNIDEEMYLRIASETFIELGFTVNPDIRTAEAATFFESRQPESGIILLGKTLALDPVFAEQVNDLLKKLEMPRTTVEQIYFSLDKIAHLRK